MDLKTIDSFLFNEMNEAEREQFENRLLVEEDLFAEIADRENDLVDLYVRNELTGDDLARYEQSLDRLPARRNKIENARLLREFISDERPSAETITIAERSGFFSRLFSFGSPAFQFASIGVIAILAAAAIFFLVENRRLNSLQSELAAARAREAELSSIADSQTEATTDLTRDLTAARERIAKLEDDLAKARGGRENNTTPAAGQPTIATLILPAIGTRGPIGAPSAHLDLVAGVTRVSVVIVVPSNAPERVSIKLNGGEIAKNSRVRTANGEKTVPVTVGVSRLRGEMNEIEVVGPAGERIVNYPFTVKR